MEKRTKQKVSPENKENKMTIKEQFPLAVDTLSKCEKPFYYDEGSQMIFSKEGKMIIDVRGWGWIQKLDMPQNRQDQIGEMFTDFLNKNI